MSTREEAIDAYAKHVGSMGYDANERTLLVIGYVAGLDATATRVDASDCDHEFTDHCVTCGVDAHEWFARDINATPSPV